MTGRVLFSVLVLVFCLAQESSARCRPPRASTGTYFRQISSFFGRPSPTYYEIGSSVRYYCRFPQCRMSGSANRRCSLLPGGRYGWTSEPPTCDCSYTTTTTYLHPTPSYQCDRPSDPPHGEVHSYPNSKQHFFLGDHVSYQCGYGYQLSSTAQVTCGNSGWSHTPTCDAVHSCNRPENPENGGVYSTPYRSSFSVGQWVTYRCNSGYCMSGDEKVYCKNSGWSHTPSCQAGCKGRKAPDYGSHTTSSSYWCPGDHVNYLCNRGFEMDGTPRAVCGPNYKWNSDVPRCRKVCIRGDPPRYASVVSTPANKLRYRQDEHVTYRCNTGYCMSGDADVYCRHTGWGALPSCASGCKHRDAPSYGSYRGTKRHWCPGDRARYACNRGFRMVGEEYSRCGASGEWQHAVPTCQRVCRRPADPQYGSIVSKPPGKTSYNDGEYVTYQCNRGYCLNGKADVYCRHRGWEDASTCRSGCRHRGAPEYGAYYGDNRHWCPGSRARFRCNRSFRMVGDEYSSCGPDGNWGSDVPKCRKVCDRPNNPPNGYIISNPRRKTHFDQDESLSYRCSTGYCLHGQSDVKCLHTGWASSPSCRSGCPHRDPPSYGSYKGARDQTYWCPEARAEFACDDTFEMVGDQYSTCGGNGRWGSDVPSCRKICPRPENPRYGTVSYRPRNKRDFRQGDTVTYSCNVGYCMQGSPEGRCTHTGWTTPPTCARGCGRRNPPRYGSYHENKPYWCPGDRAQYACNPTFQRYGDEYSTCRRDGSWDNQVPRCRKVCDRPANPQYGYVVSAPARKQRYNEDDTVRYECNSGYCRHGNALATCTHTGWSDAATCNRGCGRRDPPSYGSYKGAQDKTYWCPEARAEFACDDTFEMVGDQYSTCGGNGRWGSDVPSCRKICPRPENPRYGTVSYRPRNKRDFRQGDTVTYSCNVGYCMQGSPEGRCTHTGWTTPPTCARGCGRRNPPRYGSYKDNKPYWCPGDRAQYACNPTFRRYGDEYSTCGRDGSWDNDVPRCGKICDRPADPQYGYIVSNPSRKQKYEERESVRYECNPGYCRNGRADATCTHNGWDGAASCVRGCSHRPPPSYGGQYGEKNVWCPGDKVGYHCQQYYQMRGYANSTCQPDSSWNNNVPACHRVCRPPRRFENGWIEPRTKRSYGLDEAMTFHCNDGYCLHGDPNAYCKHNGWTSFPTCRPGCAHRDPPQYGSSSTNKTYYCPGEQASYRCRRYYQMYGDADSTCLYRNDRSSWSHRVPSCRRMCDQPKAPSNGRYEFTPGTSPRKPRYAVEEYLTVRCSPGYCGGGNRYCTHSGWGPDPVCRHGCPRREPPNYGFYEGENEYWCPGDNAKYQCRYGYEMRGDASVACGNNYRWNKPVPTCLKICQLPEVPKHANVHAEPAGKKRFVMDESVTVRCYDGYQLNGNSTVYCRHNGWTNLPTCRRTCPKRDAPDNGRYVGRVPNTWYLDNVARYECNSGYKIYGSPTSTCQFDGSWSFNVPKCHPQVTTRSVYSSTTRRYPPTPATRPTYRPTTPEPRPTYRPRRTCRGNCGRGNVGGCRCDSQCSYLRLSDCCPDYRLYCFRGFSG